MKQKSIYSQLLKIFVPGAVISWITYTYGWNNIRTTVLQAHLSWLFGGVLLFVISVFFGAIQWQIILENKKVILPFEKTLRLYFIGIFFNNFILGTIAGDAFKVASLHLDKRDGKASFAATFLDRLAGLIALSLFAIVGGAIIFVLNLQQTKQFFMVLGVLALFIGIFFGFFIILLSQRLQNALRILLQKLPAFPGNELIQSVLEETFINRRGKDDRRMLIQVGFLSLVIQSLRILVNIFAAQALGIFSFSTIHYFFVIIPIVALMVTIPMPFGVRETVGGILFGLAGFSVEQSVVMLFLATIVCISGSLVGGIMFLLDEKARRSRGRTKFRS